MKHTSPSSFRRLQVPLLLLAAAFASLLFFLLRTDSGDRSPTLREQVPGSGKETTPEHRRRTDVVPLETSRTEVINDESADLVVHVRDEDDQPVAGALVASCNFLPRTITNEQKNDLGMTDADGILEIRLPQGQDRPQHLYVRASGFVPHAIITPPWGSRVYVRLARSIDFRARVVDQEGSPVKGAVLSMSRTPLKSYAFDLSDSPGPVARESVHTATSDGDGFLVVRGLSRGEYDYRLLHRSYVWAEPDSEFRRPGMSLPHPPRTFTVTRMRACYKRLTGVRVLASAYSYNAGSGNWHWDQLAPNIRAQMHADDDESIIFALCNGYSHQRNLVVRAFLEGEGWREFTWPFTPFTIGDPPEEVVVESRGAVEGLSGSFRITLRDARGELLGVHRLLVSEKSKGFSVAFVNGVEKQVPCGEYRIRSDEAFLNDLLKDATVTVNSDECASLDMQLNLIPCRWELRIPDGRELVGMAAARITSSGKEGETLMTVFSGEPVLLPKGAIQVELMAKFYRSRVMSFLIGEGMSYPQAIKCQLF